MTEGLQRGPQPGRPDAALERVVSAGVPDSLRRLPVLVRERLDQARRLERPPPERFGFRAESAARMLLLTGLLRRLWFRVETHGIGQLPDGPFLLAAHHGSHVLSWDGAMIVTVCLLDADPPRLVHGMAEHRLMQLPLLGHAARRIGAVDGNPADCLALLRAGAAVLAFPEGVRALGRRFRDRYRIERFGTGFARVALEAGVPVVPVVAIGSEEEAPLFANPAWLRRLLRVPVAPLTPTLVLPLPVKYRIHFGAPIRLAGPPTGANVAREAARVRDALEALVRGGLAARRRVFW
jgi:1-acyl-sn-glycerol-3-phosphate acyltransferase